MSAHIHAVSMNPDTAYVLPDEPNLDKPLSPRQEAYQMVYESGLASAKEWPQFYFDKAVTDGDTKTASYWQAVIVQVGEIEREQEEDLEELVDV